MNNKPIGKTPYEIRLELLQLAQVILNEKHKAAGVTNGNNIDTSPTTEEIIAEAEKMNRFISNGNTL
jgi:hypothetical protein